VFFKGSRYEKVPEGTFTDAGGRTIPYKLTRFIPDTPAITGHRVVTPGYLSVLGVRLTKGRLLSESDTADAPLVVVINEDLSEDGRNMSAI